MGPAVLIGLGAVFVLVEGLTWIEFGRLLEHLTFGFIGGDFVLKGFAIAGTGIVLLLAAWLVRVEPHHHFANGLLALILVLGSLYLGFGGFYLGALFSGIGGLWAVFWSPPSHYPAFR